jgi:hypothetical protein
VGRDRGRAHGGPQRRERRLVAWECGPGSGQRRVPEREQEKGHQREQDATTNRSHCCIDRGDEDCFGAALSMGGTDRRPSRAGPHRGTRRRSGPRRHPDHHRQNRALPRPWPPPPPNRPPPPRPLGGRMARGVLLGSRRAG